MNFKGKVVIVTGGAAGIGLETARMFSALGAVVAINDLGSTQVEEAVRGIEAEGGVAMALVGDAADAEVAQRSVASVVERHGRVDVLVNNAGIFQLETARTVSVERWKQVTSVNLDSVFYWSQAAAVSSMIPNRSGAIVNVASVAGLVGVPNAASYVASKHAVVGLTKALAIEWGQHNIRVNAICPGVTTTAMVRATRAANPKAMEERERRIPLGHSAAPMDQGNAILFLASDLASSVHGIAMQIDGGTVAMSSGSSVQPDL
jgi:NAD(P)-dependent dehydrogenase (short-subunit alcohol dehydrogenase family)